jgi:hypothetical protein
MPTTTPTDTQDDEEQPQDDALQGFWHYYLNNMSGGGGEGGLGGLFGGMGLGGLGGILGGGLLPALLSYGGTKKYQQGLADKKAATASNPAAPATPAVAQAQPQTPAPSTSSQVPSNLPQATKPDLGGGAMGVPTSGVPGGMMSGSNGAPMPGMAAPIKLPPPQSAGMAALGQFGALQNQNPAAQNTRQAAGMATGNAASVGISALLKKLLASRGM